MPFGLKAYDVRNDSGDESTAWEDIFYPLLLQRTIEGVNKHNVDNGILKYITTDPNAVRVKGGGFELMASYHHGDSIDAAKRSALEYVFEQEKI